MTAIYLTNLADMYQTMGQYAKAEPLFQQALAIRKKVLGDQHADTGTSLAFLGAIAASEIGPIAALEKSPHDNVCDTRHGS